MTTEIAAHSIAPFAAELLSCEPHCGVGIGGGHVRVRDRVLAVTPPGAPRMPNGIEAAVRIAAGQEVWVGGGALRTDRAVVGAGELWDPRPRPAFAVGLDPQPIVHPGSLPGAGPGLPPLGDDILIGWLAGAALAGARHEPLALWAQRAGRRSTPLGATLLELAARGELPEVAHLLLEHGFTSPLLDFGPPAGAGIALGLGLIGSRTFAQAGAHHTTAEFGVPLPSGIIRTHLLVAHAQPQHERAVA